MDARIKAFEDEVAAQFAALSAAGFEFAPVVRSGTPTRRPYSLTITIRSPSAEVTCSLVLAFAGEDAVVTRAQSRDGFGFEESAPAHKGQEVRKAVRGHASLVLARLIH